MSPVRSAPRAVLPLTLAAVALAGVAAVAGAAAEGPAAPPGAAPGSERPAYAAVSPDHAIQFPADHGSHPDFRTEWWYVTGWLSTPSGEPLGFQVTFFRSHPALDERNPSAFAPRQLLIAHCALSDVARGRLWQDQRIRRAGFGLAEAAVGDADVRIEGWTFKREPSDWRVRIDAQDFALHLDLSTRQPPVLNGTGGVSRKGADPRAASYYYSVPHLAVTGTVVRAGRETRVSGEAWLDHEWSSEYLDDQAVGWDWTGLNLDDGSSLMAFRIRGTDGGTRWAGATRRDPDGRMQVFDPGEVSFEPLRRWRSQRTGITYPVSMHLRVGTVDFDLKPLLDDQENDTRITTGAIYWEGAVRALRGETQLGRGYLELTGYGERLKLR